MSVSVLRRKLETIRRRLSAADICPEHRALTGAWPVDYREGLQAFSPDPAERAAYHARVDRIEAQPPCSRCGWKPFAVRAIAAENWGQHGDPVA